MPDPLPTPLRFWLIDGYACGLPPSVRPPSGVEIGLSSDGWRLHAGDTCPVAADASVDCVWANGEKHWGVCGKWKGWAENGERRIVAYRFTFQSQGQDGQDSGRQGDNAQSPRPAGTTSVSEGVASGAPVRDAPEAPQAGETSPHHAALVKAFKAGAVFLHSGYRDDPEVAKAATAYANEHAPKDEGGGGVDLNVDTPVGRPLAASELQEGDRVRVTVDGLVVSRPGERLRLYHEGKPAHAWTAYDGPQTIHLLHREPDPLRVGDRVMLIGEHSDRGTILHIHKGDAWVAGDSGGDTPWTLPLSDLRRIEPDDA